MKSVLLYTTLPNVGGNATQTMTLCSFFRSCNIKVTVLIKSQDKYPISNKMIGILKDTGCDVRILSVSKINDFFTVLEAIKIARSIKANSFISIGMGHAAPILSLFGNCNKKYFYYINHDPKVEAVKRFGYLIKAFDAILVVSAVSIPPINALKMGVKALWMPQFSELHVKNLSLEKTSSNFRFGFIGAFKKSKGILALLSIWSTLSHDFYLDILGDGEERLAVEQAACTNNKINYLGSFFASERESVLPKFLGNIDYLLVPSIGHGEGIPTVILEALSLGVPVITTKGGGTIVFEDSLLKDDFNNFVILVDEEAFLDTILGLEKPLDTKKDEIIRVYKKWFSDDVISKKWLEILS